MDFMLCASMDTPKNILLDEQKYSRIQTLENTGEYYFNRKYDGLRLGLEKTADGTVKIPNRRGVDYAVTKNVPEIEAIGQLFPPATIIDGEGVVYCDPSNCPPQNKGKCQMKVGHPCRSLTQTRFASKTNFSQALIERLPAVFIVWDIRMLAGENLEQKPLSERLKILEEFVQKIHDQGNDSLKMAIFIETGAVEMFKGEPEGLVAKRKDSVYLPMDEDMGSDRRPALWIKIKHTYIETVDVVGYCSDSEGRLSGVGMRNVVIVDKNGEYIGTVGGGFTDADRHKLKNFFDAHTQEPAPWQLASKIKGSRTFVYVPNTQLKLRIAYQEITANNIRYAPRTLDILWPEIVEGRPVFFNLQNGVFPV